MGRLALPQAGVTLVEGLTLVVALVVIAAVAIPLWRTGELRSHRQIAVDALLAIQAAQDRHFGEHARYTDLTSLGVDAKAGDYTLEVERGDDQLSYVARARAVRVEGVAFDARCVELGLDQHGRRFARDESRADSTGDCWERK